MFMGRKRFFLFFWKRFGLGSWVVLVVLGIIIRGLGKKVVFLWG